MFFRSQMVILLCLLSFSASATDDFVILREVTENHCMLMQTAPLNPAPTMGKRIEELTQTPDEFSIQTQYEHAPDFGFLLPSYWPVMSWAQRVRFNHGITALIKHRLNIPQKELADGYCQSQIRIIEHPEQLNEDVTQNALPQPPRLQAIILMKLRGQKGEIVPLTYFYSKEWNKGWLAEDLLIYTHSTSEKDSVNLEKTIKLNGLDALEAHLETLLQAYH